MFEMPTVTAADIEGEVVLTVSGLVFDLVVYDPDDLQNMAIEEQGLGAKARTLVNESISLRFAKMPKRVVARSLWGEQFVPVLGIYRE